MSALPQEDLSHLEEPRSYREMFQRIMFLMETERKGRADEREIFETFITQQSDLNKKMDDRLKNLENCQFTHKEAIDTMKKQMAGWNVINSLGVVVASIMGFLGLKGS